MAVLLHQHEREAIATAVVEAIDAWCKEAYDDGHRNHLGASMIGGVCNRRLWYVFRWVKASIFDGRMQRLFNRGHKEEARFIEWLRGIGFTIWDMTEDGNQFRISGVGGHFGGSLDSIGLAPAWLPQLSNHGQVLVEYKTHNDKSFKKLVKDKVKKSKPMHYAQMCKYGERWGLRYAMYCAINKNDDEIHIEIVELDWNEGYELEAKASDIIVQKLPPKRFSEVPTHLECKFCDLLDVCHGGAKYEVNCRSCQFATPVANAEWHCGKYGQIIPKEFIPNGCPEWFPVGRQSK